MSSMSKRARVAKETGIAGASVFMVIVSVNVEVTEFGDDAFVHCYDDMAVEHTRQMYCEDIESKYSAPLARVFGTAEEAASLAHESEDSSSDSQSVMFTISATFLSHFLSVMSSIDLHGGSCLAHPNTRKVNSYFPEADGLVH
jgi:hypothetical protein